MTEASAGAGPAFGEGPPPTSEQDPPARDPGGLAAELREIAGEKNVYTHEHQQRHTPIAWDGR